MTSLPYARPLSEGLLPHSTAGSLLECPSSQQALLPQFSETPRSISSSTMSPVVRRSQAPCEFKQYSWKELCSVDSTLSN